MGHGVGGLDGPVPAMSGYAKPLPRVTADNRPFWEAARRHQLALQRCAECGRFRYPPAPVCPECLSERAEWTPMSASRASMAAAVVSSRCLSSLIWLIRHMSMPPLTPQTWPVM